MWAIDKETMIERVGMLLKQRLGDGAVAISMPKVLDDGILELLLPRRQARLGRQRADIRHTAKQTPTGPKKYTIKTKHQPLPPTLPPPLAQ